MTGFRKSKVARREGGGGSERRSRREMCTNTPERAHSTSAPSSHDLSTLAASVVSAICAVQAPANTPAQHAAHVLEGSACTAPPEAVTPPQTEKEDEVVVVSAPEQGESAHATSQEDQREERAERKRVFADLSDPYEEAAILDYLVPAKRERNARRKMKKARKQDQGTAWAVQVMESKGEGDQRQVKIWYLVPDPEHPKDLSKRQPLEKEICRKRIVCQDNVGLSLINLPRQRWPLLDQCPRGTQNIFSSFMYNTGSLQQTYAPRLFINGCSMQTSTVTGAGCACMSTSCQSTSGSFSVCPPSATNCFRSVQSALIRSARDVPEASPEGYLTRFLSLVSSACKSLMVILL